MIEKQYSVPISPPYSPRMSDATAKKHEYQFHSRSQQPASHGGGAYEGSRSYSQAHSLPSLRSYGGFAYHSDPSRTSDSEGGHQGLEHSGASTYDKQLVSGPQPSGSGEVQHTTFDASVPTSPADQLTPRSSRTSLRDQPDDDEIDDTGNEDLEEPDETAQMTAAELRAHKRKMKRFRLTHNQTRFLVSEFARQAHPDAAHRERLAREIPGLTARQVQVWFQNRRAKLKRLTTDDRDRMMRSRALPADFDTTQALHSHFGAQHPPMGTPESSFLPYGEVNRPLTLDTLRRIPEYEHYGQHYASPSGVSPAMSAFAFTPPQSASDQLSPAQAASSIHPYMLQPQQQVQYDGSRRPPTGLPTSAHSDLAEQSHLQRNLVPQERLNRTLGESIGSSLRTSLSYSNMYSTNAQSRLVPERASSFSDASYHPQRPRMHNVDSPGISGTTPYGLGFAYTSAPNYQRGDQQQHSAMPDSTHHATDQLQRATLPTSTFSSPPHVAQYYATAQYPSHNFTGTYLQHEHSTAAAQSAVREYQQPQPDYPSLTNTSQPFMQLGTPSTTQATEEQGHDGGLRY